MRTGIAGMRLGELERTLLTQASRPGRFGLLIDAPEGTRSAQQGYLRAAKKLEDRGLLVRERIPQIVRVPLRNGQGPFCRRGRFWLRTSRRQVVFRIAVWVTPFGEGVRKVYAEELLNGRPIRWTEARLRLAERYEQTHWNDPDEQRAAVNSMSECLDDEEPEDSVIEHRPDEVKTDYDAERWLVATAAARRLHPRAGSARLWDAARRLYRSRQSLGRLREKAGWKTRPRPDRHPLRFKRVGELGIVIPTDPEIARRARRRSLEESRRQRQPSD